MNKRLTLVIIAKSRGKLDPLVVTVNSGTPAEVLASAHLELFEADNPGAWCTGDVASAARSYWDVMEAEITLIMPGQIHVIHTWDEEDTETAIINATAYHEHDAPAVSPFKTSLDGAVVGVVLANNVNFSIGSVDMSADPEDARGQILTIAQHAYGVGALVAVSEVDTVLRPIIGELAQRTNAAKRDQVKKGKG